MNVEIGWSNCVECSSLVLDPVGRCPGGGLHDTTDSGDYVVPYESSANSRTNWRHCESCQSLVFAGSGSGGRCTTGLAHTFSQKGYRPEGLPNFDATREAVRQSDWRWCCKCDGMTYCDADAPGNCATGGVHDDTRSGVYSMVFFVRAAIAVEGKRLFVSEVRPAA